MTGQPQLIIYTRNLNVDYRMVVAPDEHLCPSETRKYFRKLIRGAIDVETYDDPLDEPRWLYARKNDVILFGIAAMLETFETEYFTDFTGRNVRGFFGIVISASADSVQLPYSFEFFQAINRKYIEPLWDAPKESFIRKCIEIDLNEYDVEMLSMANETIALNMNSDECKILGQVDMKEALQSALSSGGELSLISGLNNKQHAFATEADYDFMNAIVNGVLKPENHKKTSVIGTSQSSDSVVTPPPVPQQSKKVNRPKMLILVLLVVTVFIVIVLVKTCNASMTNHNSSTSGDQNRINQSDSILKKN